MNLRILFVLTLAALILAACAEQDVLSATFLLRTEQIDVPAAASLAEGEIIRQLADANILPQDYPRRGYVQIMPDPYDPALGKISCVLGERIVADSDACILLNDEGDFIRVKAVTWQSETVYMYRIFIAPKCLFAKIDPSRDFVAIDSFIFIDVDLWTSVDIAIRSSALGIGAKPFRP